MMRNVIETTIWLENGYDVLLPRIQMICHRYVIRIQMLEFPMRLALATTINKAQGQSLQVYRLNLEKPGFSHGQFYAACSRIGKPPDLFVYAPGGETKNIMYPTA